MTALGTAGAVRADDSATAGPWAWHVQSTLTDQATNRFAAPYSGANSLLPDPGGKATFDLTGYVGYRPWSGGEVWADPEIDQGFGLSNTLGLAGFSSGEAYKIGDKNPYLRLQRLFLRQTFNVGGDKTDVDPDLNVFGGKTSADRVVITIGKFGVTDVFDNSVSAHDPRHDFLNWSVIDTGSFDYAADAWGYTMGAAAEVYKGPYAVRVGLFDMSNVPNSTQLDAFHQVQGIVEVEDRFTLHGRDGSLRLTGFLSRARMAAFNETLMATPSGQVPDTATDRHYRSRTGVALSGDQALSDTLKAFVRAGASDGHFETYEFTDIDRSLAAGLSLTGKAWRRDGDAIGIALVRNDISKSHAAYLAAGGLGPLIGDGALLHKASEHIAEAYYSLALNTHFQATADYQYVRNPAYNVDRGPVSIIGLRLHAQY
jgi:high affinity Mn2+ porin